MPDDAAMAAAKEWAMLARLFDPPLGKARLKAFPDDFRVEEELGFALSGAGEHLCVQVEKVGLTTIEAARLLRKAAGLKPSDIGYAGMKDRHARSLQWFSLRLPPSEESRLGSAEGKNLRIRQSQRNNRKIRIGSHGANRFVIRLRDFQGDRDEMERRLGVLKEQGVPNYFGPQRFGRLFANMDRIEGRVNEARRGEGATRMSRTERSLLYSAARARLFNQVLSARLAQGSWNRYLPGDVMSLDGSGRLFLPEREAWDNTLQKRLDDLDIHVTGPLPGGVPAQLRYATQGQAADIEDAVLRHSAATLDWLGREGLREGRRALRFGLRNPEWDWTDDNSLVLRFALARGSYATSLIRELCITDASEQETKLES